MEVEHSAPQVYQPAIDYDRVLALGRELLIALGENPDRPGLIDTPRRWASWWREFIEYDPGKTEVLFESITSNQLIVVTGIRIWSLCEHHLLPFWSDVSIGYLAHEHVLGLSKFGRVAHQFAHRLQIQERIVHQIADELERITRSPNVAVMAHGEHLCMTMRGVRSPATMTTSVMRGHFLDNPTLRAEFLQILQMQRAT